MAGEGRVAIAVLVCLSIAALLAVIGIKYVRTATRGVIESRQSRDTEAQ
jgi:hypothetical protein